MNLDQAYELLQVRPGAPEEVVRAAYRALARTRHPDAGGRPEDFRAIEAALNAIAQEGFPAPRKPSASGDGTPAPENNKPRPKKPPNPRPKPAEPIMVQVVLGGSTYHSSTALPSGAMRCVVMKEEIGPVWSKKSARSFISVVNISEAKGRSRCPMCFWKS